jgi:hypothetical protein
LYPAKGQKSETLTGIADGSIDKTRKDEAAGQFQPPSQALTSPATHAELIAYGITLTA